MRFFDGKLCSEPGSRIKVLYSPVVNDDGTISLVESGQEDLQAYIDSFWMECDLKTLIQRFTHGEINVLNQRQGTFGDFTKAPKTFAEALQMQIDSENLFKSLPKAIKERFNNDKNQFFAQSGTKEWFEKMPEYFSFKEEKQDNEKKESDVKE